MATQALPVQSRALSLELLANFPGMRALAWRDDVLYASRGYELYSARIVDYKINWERIAAYRPQWWRNGTCRTRLASRLVRDGFHALGSLQNGNLIAALPGAIAAANGMSPILSAKHPFATFTTLSMTNGAIVFGFSLVITDASAAFCEPPQISKLSMKLLQEISRQER